MNDVHELYEEGLLLTLFSGQGELIVCDTESSVANTAAFKVPKNIKTNVGKITEEDFTGEELFAFLTLHEHIRDAIQIKDNNRDSAMNWLFVPNQEANNGLTFALCCAVFSARENLLRTRVQFELYMKSIVTKLPFLSCPIPESLDLEAAGIGGDDAQNIVSLLWQNPGLRADYFQKAVDLDEKMFRRITLDLECSGLIAMKNGCWYFTGRNPLILRFGSRFSWSGAPIF